MKSMRKPIAVNRFSWAGFLVLGVVLLAFDPAGAVSGDEQSLFNVAKNDQWNEDVRSLLAKGASPNVPVDTLLQRTAIHVAAEQGAVKNLVAMLQAGGNPNLLDGEGNTPLHWATTGFTANHPAAIRFLVQHGADLHRTNHNGATPLHVAVYNVWSLNGDVVKALLDAGAKPETVDGDGMTALQGFAQSGADRGDIVTLLLNAGTNPDRKTPGGDAPLHLAVKHGTGKTSVVKALLNGGADPCVQDAEGHTPYQLSNAQSKPAIRQALDRAQGRDLACPAMQPFGLGWVVVKNQSCQIFDSYLNPGALYTWLGGCVASKASGKGRAVERLSDGGQHVYEGSIRAGKFHGPGMTTFSNGDRYVGEYRDGKPHGYGAYIAANGESYVGQWYNGCFRGRDRRQMSMNTSREACGFR
ncbi:MAG: ankyrin repeat domain-containing protein [Nitrospira sp.]|nr:ankyrin repeat domain-containing protein [Nitrospira sp.]